MADKRMPGISPIVTTVGADPRSGSVIMAFSGKIDRIEFSPEQAEGFADLLRSRAVIARGANTGYGADVDPDYEMPDG